MGPRTASLNWDTGYRVWSCLCALIPAPPRLASLKSWLSLSHAAGWPGVDSEGRRWWPRLHSSEEAGLVFVSVP